ncbi:cytosine deaminase [Komagataeibacter oboediens]|uniref:cytosine deaminase n=1 Tax=Komagataeibacter oboediens TaxID=65958 RepID=UPI001902DF55|nr:cytosine deaminase [Komagataeibacter oboediens]GCE78773.1 cytosine deaminase-like protein [Komagataeibacter oboediens]
MIDLVLTNATLPDGTRADIAIRNGLIADIAPRFTGEAGRKIDVGGHLVSPPFVDSHFHLDSTLTAGIIRHNTSGTLAEGIAIWKELKPTLTEEDIYNRAKRLCEMAIAKGNLAIRSHVDTSPEEPRAVRALLALQKDMKPWIDIQLVAFPQDGFFRMPGAAARLEHALDMGVNLVGGIPHFERTTNEGTQSIEALFRIAADRGLSVDMHCDETDDASSRHAETMAACTIRYGLQGRVAGSHLASMHSIDNAYAGKLIGMLADSGMGVIANPLINITLQGRYDTYPKRRGLARIRELVQAGVPVGFGHDCVMDPWYRLGSHDMLEVASMGAHVGHMTGEEELLDCYRAVTENAARIMELDGYGLAVGKRADMVVLQASSPIEALRLRPTRLYVIRAGKIIAQSPAQTTILHLDTPFEEQPIRDSGQN